MITIDGLLLALLLALLLFLPCLTWLLARGDQYDPDARFPTDGLATIVGFLSGAAVVVIVAVGFIDGVGLIG